jgi:hypothetical protein
MRTLIITEECPRCRSLEQEGKRLRASVASLEQRVHQLGRVRAELQDREARLVARLEECGGDMEAEVEVIVQGHPYTLTVSWPASPGLITDAALKEHGEPSYLEQVEWELRDADGMLLTSGGMGRFKQPLFLNPRPGFGG